MPEPVVVIGAGLAGLYVSKKLSGKTRPLVLEAGATAGGRIRTIRDEDGRVRYEAGPWRVATSHRRMMRLLQEEGLSLGPSDSMSDDDTTDDALRGLSVWELNALRRRNPLSADYADLATGFADEHHAASGSKRSAAHEFVVAKNGIDALVEHMSESLHILYNTRVVDVRRNTSEYVVQCRCRETDDEFVNRIYHATSIFICVPPHCAERWTVIGQWARAQLYAVQPLPLHHIYAQSEGPVQPQNIRSPSTLLGQSVASQHGNDWFQLSYTGGRLARFWHNLKMTSPAMFMKTLMDETRRYLGNAFDPKSTQSYFYENAYHIWRPNAYFSLKRAVQMSIAPNIRHLPNIYWCGEAFSSFQGWMEGSLETADLALELYMHGDAYTLSRRKVEAHEVVLEGRILDASRWAEIHPGGEEAIRNHLNKNVTDLFYHVRHSVNAWAIVYSLQTAIEK